MIVDLAGTSSTRVATTLVELRDTYGAVALGRVLTLVALADGADVEQTIASANHASHEHPLRVIVVQRYEDAEERRRGHDQQPHLDAQVRLGGDAGASEVVVLHAAPALTQDVLSLVTPLLLPDAPTVAWWAGEAPNVTGDTTIGRMAHRRITDAAACHSPLAAIRDRAESYQPGDGDLAWARLTLWRATLAAAMDVVTSRGSLPRAVAVEVHGSVHSPSVDLLAAWLSWSLHVSASVGRVPGDGLAAVRIALADGEQIVLERPDGDPMARLSVPGQPTRPVSLPHRTHQDCLAEELRRLEPDPVYGEVLTHGLPRVIPA
jgi:glucose-6-phosphate dehydrogenase assembly protein OpcA